MEAGSSGKATHQRVSWYHSVARATRIADFPIVYTLIESRLRELWTLDCFAMDDFLRPSCCPTSKETLPWLPPFPRKLASGLRRSIT